MNKAMFGGDFALQGEHPEQYRQGGPQALNRFENPKFQLRCRANMSAYFQ